jgi:hypothetical protein
LCRMLYASRLCTKAKLMEYCTGQIAKREERADFVTTIEDWREALAEANGLPDDPPQT